MAPSDPVTVSTPAAGTLKLPVLVFGMVEVRRLKRELESLEEFMRQAALRQPGKAVALPRVSRLLDALAAENHLNLLQSGDRKQLADFLKHIEQAAPSIHVSFAVDPSSAFTAKIVTWLRANIAPDALLDVGLQPTIAAGCIVRTMNKIFDLSLRQNFADASGLLLEALEKGGTQPPAGVAAGGAAPTAPVTEGEDVVGAGQPTGPQTLVSAVAQPAVAQPASTGAAQ